MSDGIMRRNKKMIELKRDNEYYRPYVTNVNNVKRFIDKIYIYDESGVILKINQGWLENGQGQDISKIELEGELLLRRKENFDGKCYIMNTKSNYRDEKRCILYIPNNLVGFEKTNRYLNFNYTVIDVWESEIIGAKYEVWRHDFGLNDKLYELRREFDDVKKQYDFKIDSNIDPFIAKLKELKKEYEEEIKQIQAIDINKL